VKNQAKQKRQVLRDKQTSWKNTFLSGLCFRLFSLPFTTHSFFANHANVCFSVSAIFASRSFALLGVGAQSAAVALLSICNLFYGVPPLGLRSHSV